MELFGNLLSLYLVSFLPGLALEPAIYLGIAAAAGDVALMLVWVWAALRGRIDPFPLGRR